MGTVYRVHDHVLGREVALKTMIRPSPEASLRIKNEFRARAGLTHPNLLRLYELFVSDDLCFFTMEIIEGVDFRRWVSQSLGVQPSAFHRKTGPFSTQAISDSLEQSLEVATRVSFDSSLADAPESWDEAAPNAGERGALPAALGSRPPVSSKSWARLRAGVAQLVRGLDALHASGRIHRDVKPNNVFVAEGDRVVLLDFGLAIEARPPSEARDPRREIAGVAASSLPAELVGQSTASLSIDFAGTPAFMAPEQAARQHLTGAADFFALGVMLYEALTGRLPFGARGVLLFNLKGPSYAAPVGQISPGTPADVADLVMDLLAWQPDRRPSASSCLARLGEPVVPPGHEFVGRAAELAMMEALFDEVTAKRAQITLHVKGPSGIGKSTLLREFVAKQKRTRGAIVLQGRCHPEESVPYKALDAVVDAMAQRLDARGLVSEAQVPAGAHALLLLFPVFAKIPAFRAAPAPPEKLDALELRRHGALALRELLHRFAETQPVIVWLDDVQWGDLDSASLLDEILGAPGLPLLLLLSYRAEEQDRSPLIRRLREASSVLGEPADLREIALGALGEHEVAELARTFLPPDGGVATARIESIVAQSEGNPFIACELARHARSLGPIDEVSTRRASVDVEALILERVRALEPAEQRFLETAAVAGKPLAREVALAAAGLDEGARPLIAALRDANLLREVVGDSAIVVAPYHDRIREALLATLPATARARAHERIAQALTARGSDDLEALLVHWEGAGDRPRAFDHAVRAAERAAAALAFDHAAALYEKSLDLLAAPAERPMLLERLGEVLANRGRAPEAADRFLEAAAALGGGMKRRVHDLRRRAAEQFIKSGRIDQGWHEMRTILVDLDIPVPRSALGAVAGASWRRVVFLLQSIDLEERSYTPPPPDELHRMDVLWSASTGWAMINYTLADMYRVIHLLRAIKASDASTLSRALAYEAAMECHVGGSFFDRSAGKLLDKAATLARRTDNSYDRAWLALGRANYAYTHGRWRETAEACAEADNLFREHCPGSAWERVTIAIFHHQALALAGDLPRLTARLDEFRADAILRNDIHAICEAHVNEPVIAWLARDRAEEARAQASQALAAQTARRDSWPENSCRRQLFADLVANVYASAYLGTPWPAWRAVLEMWPGLESAFLLPLRITGLLLRHMRARAALAAAAALANDGARPPPGVDQRWTRGALLRDARRQLRAIVKDPAGCAEPLASTIRAGLARLEGNRGDAERELARAALGFDREEMAIYREVARYARGALRRGSEGEAERQRAEEWMSARGVVKPEAMVAAMMPGAWAPHH